MQSRILQFALGLVLILASIAYIQSNSAYFQPRADTVSTDSAELFNRVEYNISPTTTKNLLGEEGSTPSNPLSTTNKAVTTQETVTPSPTQSNQSIQTASSPTPTINIKENIETKKSSPSPTPSSQAIEPAPSLGAAGRSVSQVTTSPSPATQICQPIKPLQRFWWWIIGGGIICRPLPSPRPSYSGCIIPLSTSLPSCPPTPPHSSPSPSWCNPWFLQRLFTGNQSRPCSSPTPPGHIQSPAPSPTNSPGGGCQTSSTVSRRTWWQWLFNIPASATKQFPVGRCPSPTPSPKPSPIASPTPSDDDGEIIKGEDTIRFTMLLSSQESKDLEALPIHRAKLYWYKSGREPQVLSKPAQSNLKRNTSGDWYVDWKAADFGRSYSRIPEGNYCAETNYHFKQGSITWNNGFQAQTYLTFSDLESLNNVVGVFHYVIGFLDVYGDEIKEPGAQQTVFCPTNNDTN